ncbi:MAG: 16S rRNA (cytidine(1402)-2'-O)-methyltransferase [Chloroflexi bacterium]|nr:16S rRNA (cytidine(1402)-2'-O)-methyltransferase [Chloroflexota bacterium]
MLYLVATPIGNLGDISLRAIETLREVDWVASEDTRKTGHLLKHYGISKPQLAFHAHNEAAAAARVVGLLRQGLKVALVSNAGTPGISDPGYSLVRAAHAAGIGVTMVPGASALIMALVLSGLPAHSFTFRGFPPNRSAARRRFFAGDLNSLYTLIYYESSHRIAASLQDAAAVFGARPAALCNDLTKFYERVERATLDELAAAIQQISAKGEYVLLIQGAD